MASKTYYFNGGWLRPAIAREGRRQKAIRRMLIGYGDRLVSTSELAQAAYPRTDVRHLAPWQWFDVRRIAERCGAERCEPRRRPHLWRVKPELLAGKGRAEKP